MNTNHIIASLLMLTAALGLHAGDNISSLGEKGSFVINGNVDPSFGNLFEMAVTGYIENRSEEITIDNEGNFLGTIAIEGPIQEAYLYVDNDAVTIPVVPDDTITVDYRNGRLSLSGCNEGRDRDLKFALHCHDAMRRHFIGINRQAYGQLDTDSAIVALADSINSYISLYNKLIEEFEAANGPLLSRDYFANDAYFGTLCFAVVKPETLSHLNERLLGSNLGNPYSSFNGNDMKYPATRKFATQYITKLASDACLKIYSPGEMSSRIINAARGIAPDLLTADIVIAERISTYLKFDSYEKIWPIADMALKEMGTEWLNDRLSEMLENHKLTSAGRDLPLLKLTDGDGNELTIDSFKGKTVLLDFWAIGCGPCMSEFKEMKNFKEALADKADRLQIVTVCCQNPEKERWKSIIERYNLDDMNTMLMHKESAPIYTSFGWPTYILVGPDGKIIEWNTDRPSIVLIKKQLNLPTTLDALL